MLQRYLQFCHYADKGDVFLDLGESSKLLIAEVVTGGISSGETSHDKVISAICVIILIVVSDRLSASANRRETGRGRFSRKEFTDVVSISSWYWLWVAISTRSYRYIRSILASVLGFFHCGIDRDLWGSLGGSLLGISTKSFRSTSSSFELVGEEYRVSQDW